MSKEKALKMADNLDQSPNGSLYSFKEADLWKIIEIASKHGWISVEDKEPHLEGWYIIYKQLTNLVTFGFHTDGYFEDDNVTHWMPLPEKP